MALRARRKLRARLATEQNYRCAYCGKRCAEGEMTLEHLKPKSHGGRAIYANCVMACAPCNFGRDRMDPTQFYYGLISSRALS